VCVCVCVCVCITKDDHGRLVLRSVIFMKELLEKVMQGSRSNGPANNAMFLLPPRFITIPRVRGVNGHEVHELVDRVRDGSQGPEDHEACTKLSEDCRWIVVTVAHCADCDDSKVEGIVKVEAAVQEENTLIRGGVVLRADCDDSKVEGIVKVEAAVQEENTLIRGGVVLRADCDDSKVEGIVKVEAAVQEENTLIRGGVVLRADCDDSKVEGIVKVEAGRKEETVTLAEQEENTLIREGVVLRAEHLFRSQTGDSYTGSTRDLLLNKKRPTIRGKETWSCPTILAGCPSG
jgi:hypothetical protein